MLAQAARTKLYDRLHEGELVSFLRGRAEGEADLVLAADVLVYMADLDAVFAEAHRVLGPGGLFAFTVQAHDGDGFILGEDARYAHGESYLRKLAELSGLRSSSWSRSRPARIAAARSPDGSPSWSADPGTEDETGRSGRRLRGLRSGLVAADHRLIEIDDRAGHQPGFRARQERHCPGHLGRIK